MLLNDMILTVNPLSSCDLAVVLLEVFYLTSKRRQVCFLVPIVATENLLGLRVLLVGNILPILLQCLSVLSSPFQ